MEYVAGRTLRDILREGRKILPERALEITSGVLSALDYSHRAGIIHRDIKPGNVMLTPSGDVKVMDFGIARAISDASSTMTQTAAVVGTAQYLSPEQARGETVDSRSDVYSAGCLLYELLTGRPPFVGRQPGRGGLPARPRAGRAAVRPRHRPPARDRRDRDEVAGQAASRTATSRAAAMRTDIERYLAGRPVARRRPAGPADRGDPGAAADRGHRPQAAGPPPTTRTRTGAAPGCWSLLGLLVIALIVAGVRTSGRGCSRRRAEQVQVPDLIGLTEDAGPRRDRRRRA